MKTVKELKELEITYVVNSLGEPIFHRFAVVSTDNSHTILTVKEYVSIEEYDKDIDLMHSQFEKYNEAKRECRRLARLNGGKSLV